MLKWRARMFRWKVEELEKAAADKWDAVNKEVETALEDVKKAVKE